MIIYLINRGKKELIISAKEAKITIIVHNFRYFRILFIVICWYLNNIYFINLTYFLLPSFRMPVDKIVLGFVIF